jgi:hypothetical protein
MDPLRRFLNKVKKTNNCWLWEASLRNKDGYGQFRLNGKMRLAHRVSWQLFNGATTLSVLHKCDNPPCVNPNHLFLGSQLDNIRDCINKGRFKSNVGENNPRAKLSITDVYKIKNRLNSGLTQSKIGKIFGVSQSAISRIKLDHWGKP